MLVAATSVQSYHRHRPNSSTLGKQKARLCFALRFGDEFTRSELAKAACIRLSSVCARVAELLHAGLLARGKPRRCTVTGIKVSTIRRARPWKR